MEDNCFIVSSVRPTLLRAIEPEQLDVDLFVEKSPERVAADRLLSLASSVYSRWFLLMRSIMTRERVVTRARIEAETGKKVHGELTYSKAKCERQPLTAADEATVNSLEATVRAVFGDEAADFAKDRFIRAISTGDKRSFKIRFLFYKSCDGLKNTTLFAYFRERLEDVVTEAEEAAGCVPDPSPRRLSLAEQERKRRKEAEPKQMDLFDQPYVVEALKAEEARKEARKEVVDDVNEDRLDCNDGVRGMAASDVPDARGVDGVACLGPRGGGVEVHSGTGEEGHEGKQGSKGKGVVHALGNDDSGSESSGVEKPGAGHTVGSPEAGDTAGRGGSGGVAPQEACEKPAGEVRGKDAKNVRQEKGGKDGKGVEQSCPTAKKTGGAPGVVRKTRVYTTVSEIVADIQAGNITPYTSNDEIISDIKAKRLTPAEAVLFLAELGKRNRNSFRTSGIATRISKSESARFADLAKADSPSDDDLDDIDNEEEDDEDDEKGTRLPSERGVYCDDSDRGERSQSKYDMNQDDDW